MGLRRGGRGLAGRARWVGIESWVRLGDADTTGKRGGPVLDEGTYPLGKASEPCKETQNVLSAQLNAATPSVGDCPNPGAQEKERAQFHGTTHWAGVS